MTLSQRLLVLMTTAVAALLVVVAVAFVQMGHVYERANFANENIVPSITVLNRALKEFSHVRVRLYRHVLNDDDKAKADIDVKIAEAKDAVDKALKDYEPLVYNDEDRKRLEADRNAFAAYAQAVQAIQQASRAKQHDEALRVLTENVKTAEVFNTALEDHIRFNHEIGVEMAQQAVAAKRSATWIFIVIAVVAVGVVGGLGVQIRAALVARLNEANRLAERVAAGDLTSTGRREEGHDEVGQLIGSMEKMRADLAETVQHIIASAGELVDSSSALSAAAQQVSQSTETQSNSTSAAAAAVEELTVSIDHVGQNAEEASARAKEAGEKAVESGQSVAAAAGEINQVVDSVENTSRQMQALAEQVQQIGNITTVISEVADQTNLLALNAAIEAARAGEQGRGFAVVADEVRKLAERTTVSVQEIGNVIATIQNGVAAAVASMQDSRSLVGNVVDATRSASTSMESIRSATETVRAAIAEISDALREQRSASTDLARNVESVAQMSEENAASVASVAETAHRVATVSADLKSSAARFRL